MNTTLTDEMILKTDVLGRVKTPAEGREHLLEEFERSGLPGVKFAELAGIKYQTFATWIQKRRRKRGDYPVDKVPAAKKRLQRSYLLQSEIRCDRSHLTKATRLVSRRKLRATC